MEDGDLMAAFCMKPTKTTTTNHKMLLLKNVYVQFKGVEYGGTDP